MKLAIVHCIPEPSPTYGVYRRLQYQVSASRQAGIPIDFHVISATGQNKPDDGIALTVIGETTSTLDKNQREVEAVAAIMERYDVVCMRSILYSHHYWRILRNRKAKLITELHGKHLVERRNESRKLYAYESLFTAPCFRVNDGLIAMTPEIETYAHRFFLRKATQTCVISNGIDVESTAYTKAHPFDGTTLHLAMVAGIDAPWHGWERLRDGLLTYSGPVNITVHLIGGFKGPASEEIGPMGRVLRHGPMHGKDLDDLLSRMHLGCSTLALYAKEQEQACALKTREYIARGLPLIMAYDDYDLKANQPWLLRLPNDSTPVDFASVAAFAEQMARRDIDIVAGNMRSFALEHLDWKNKLQQYASFMRQVADANHKPHQQS